MTRRLNSMVATAAAVMTLAAAVVHAEPMESVATALYGSLTPQQQEKAVRQFDDPQRAQEMYTGGSRAGIQIKDLSPAQQDQALALLTAFTSDYGRKQAEAIAAQEPGDLGLGQYYLCFFGRPGVDDQYAWRIAEHHLTIVDVQVTGGQAAQFGPILLGANPPTLWNREEDLLIELYQSLTPEERRKASRPGRADAARPLAGNAGVRVGELSDAAQQRVRAAYEQRLAFFSERVRQQVDEMVQRQGGLGALRIAFWGAAEKRCADGGKWDFKLGGESFLCDYENSRGHIHLSMKGRLATPPGAQR